STAAISAAEMRAPPRLACLRSSSRNELLGDAASATANGYSSMNASAVSTPSTSTPCRSEMRNSSARPAMNTPQGGIFALGTSSHAYLEFSLADERNGAELVRTISSLREPRTTMGGVNLVVGFRPELWHSASGGQLPAQLGGFEEDLVGPD